MAAILWMKTVFRIMGAEGIDRVMDCNTIILEE